MSEPNAAPNAVGLSQGMDQNAAETLLMGRLRVSGLLVVVGLVIQVLTLMAPPHAHAFMIFATAGVGLVGMGVLWFLLAIVRART